MKIIKIYVYEPDLLVFILKYMLFMLDIVIFRSGVKVFVMTQRMIVILVVS